MGYARAQRDRSSVMAPDVEEEIVLDVLDQVGHAGFRARFRQDPVDLVPRQRIVVDRVAPVHEDEVPGARRGAFPRRRQSSGSR